MLQTKQILRFYSDLCPDMLFESQSDAEAFENELIACLDSDLTLKALNEMALQAGSKRELWDIIQNGDNFEVESCISEDFCILVHLSWKAVSDKEGEPLENAYSPWLKLLFKKFYGDTYITDWIGLIT